ncbi:amyloid-beta A4 precursor protein-binding family A member 2-like isoform X4 [Gigantopelta aegis]|uniref:amyloid-beta A4 precursor protein-binding family A member 2-like isoform X4 n=1 Tax=Gigantopelta aegis TaxID=1735272 RepID=UPI001B88B620|nr:amyloid-beta A4 precursor protein-binding family A member 2-like isoform X4 [Gigantopelta aegis]
MTTVEGHAMVSKHLSSDMEDGSDLVDGACGGETLGPCKEGSLAPSGVPETLSESLIDDSTDNVSMEVLLGEDNSRHPSELSSISYQNLLDDGEPISAMLSRRDSDESNDSFQPELDGDFPPDDIERFEASDLPLTDRFMNKEFMVSKPVHNWKQQQQQHYTDNEDRDSEVEYIMERSNIPVIRKDDSDVEYYENMSQNCQPSLVVQLRQKAASAENVRDTVDRDDAIKKRCSLEIRNNIPRVSEVKNYDKDLRDVTYSSQGAKPKMRKQSPGLARRVCDSENENSATERDGSSSERETMSRSELQHIASHKPDSNGQNDIDVSNTKEHLRILTPRKNLSIENEYDYVKYARVQQGNSYVGMRLAYSSSNDSLNLKRNSLNSQGSASLDSSRETSPEKTLQHRVVVSDQFTQQERVSEDTLTEIPLNGTDSFIPEDKKSFTLSPENTECDSVEVESVTSDGDRSTLGMPIVDDGLSSSQTSDVEDGGRDYAERLRMQQKMESEIKRLKVSSEHKAKDMDAKAIMSDLKAKREALDLAIADIKSAIQRSKGVALQSSYTEDANPSEPVWVRRDSHAQKLQQRQEEMRQVREEIERRQEEDYAEKEHNTAFEQEGQAQEQDGLLDHEYTENGKVPPLPKDSDTDEETDRLLQKQYQRRDQYVEIPELTEPPVNRSAQAEKRRSRAKEAFRFKFRDRTSVHVRDPDNPEVLIEGVLFRARYLGSTQLVSEGQPSKAMRMMQAQEAVGRIKAPEGENQPSTDVDLFVSTEKIMVLNTDLQEIMMDHSLRTISYIADIGDILVIMARRRLITSPDEQSLRRRRQAKILCHVFESDEAQLIAQSIGQAFQVAYMEFLKANGIEDPGILKEMDYQDVLNQQEIYGEELQLFANKDHHKEVIVPKAKGEPLGVVIVESGWGSMVPTVVLANMAPSGPAARCGQLNIGDQIISINGISLVGLPLSACQNQIKTSKPQTVVKLTVVPCPPVVEVLIKRPDVKYQLGFSVQNGVICSLLRGGIAERGGVRVGHRIIEINNQSVVAVPHEKIVSVLASSVGEIHMKTMPTSIFRLLTGQDTPHYL